jgi:hypothetical protein
VLAEHDHHGSGAGIRLIVARVDLEAAFLAEIAAGRSTARVLQVSGNADNLNLHVSLSAENIDGQWVESAGPDFGMSGPRRGIWHRWHGPVLPADPEEADRLAIIEHRVDIHDIEDAINQMLGRDPALHRPPRLSWGKLIAALGNAGVTVTESDLIAAPLSVELAPDVHAELARA